MKSIIAILLTVISFSAFSQESKGDFVTVLTYKDSTKGVAVMSQFVQKIVKTDTATKQDIIVVDTLWAVKLFDPIIDPKTKKQLIEKGKPKFSPNPRYVQFPSDSVRWKGIEGVPLEKLLDKKAPTH